MATVRCLLLILGATRLARSAVMIGEDPRGLGYERELNLLFLNSGADCLLAIDAAGKVVRDTGRIAGLNPGGGNFGPDGRYYVGCRNARSIMAFDKEFTTEGEQILAPKAVPFPRGFAFDRWGRLFLASGIGPAGEGDDTILSFSPDLEPRETFHVSDPEVSPLDLAIAPNGNIVVASEWPFGDPNAISSIREYDPIEGKLVRILWPKAVAYRKPRGLRFCPHNRLHCAARVEVVVFNFETGQCLGALINLPRLNGQALVFFPQAGPVARPSLAAIPRRNNR
jgi:hypothetical protein